MTDAFKTIAFVSGKGGVGKTSLATNFSYVISQSGANVLLVDLDFDNMGCTGLFAANFKLGSSNTRQLLQAEDISKCECSLTHIHGTTLWFLPASLFAEPAHSRDMSLQNPTELLQKLKNLVQYMRDHHHMDCVIFDCHGGIDASSIACAGLCDETLIVTEPDSVTFAGTLGIFDAYTEYFKNTTLTPNIRYIVNRIPPKFNWQYLNAIYEDFIARHLGRYSSVKEILAYIPSENFVAETFGSYPFQIKLAPKSLYSRKIELMAYKLLNLTAPNLIATKIKNHFGRLSREASIYRKIMTNEAKSINVVMRAFGLPPIVGLLFILSMAAAYALGVNLKIFISPYMLVIPFIAFLFYSAYGLMHSTIYINEKLAVQKGVRRYCAKTNPEASLLNVWKLQIFRTSTIFGMVAAVAYASLLVVFLMQQAFEDFFKQF